MHFQFALDLSDTDLLNIDLLDQRYTHLDLLDTDTPGKHFVCLQDVFKMSSSHVFKTSSRYVFKTSSRYVFKMSLRHVFKTSSRHFFKTFWRRLQRNNFPSCKTSSKRLQDVFTRHLQDVLKTNKCLLS